MSDMIQATAKIKCDKCGMMMLQSQADHQVRCLHDGCPLPGPAKHGAKWKEASEEARKTMGGIIIKKPLR